MNNNNNNEIDWKWQGWKNELKGFLAACAEADIAPIQRQKRQAKRIAKARKKQKKRQNRKMRNLIIARHCVKSYNNFVFGDNKRR